jgi:hypothetical protein
MRSLWAAGIGLWLAVVPLPTGAGAGAGSGDDPDRSAELRMETAVIAAIADKYNLELRSEEPLRRAARDLNMVPGHRHGRGPARVPAPGVLDPEGARPLPLCLLRHGSRRPSWTSSWAGC